MTNFTPISLFYYYRDFHAEYLNYIPEKLIVLFFNVKVWYPHCHMFLHPRCAH